MYQTRLGAVDVAVVDRTLFMVFVLFPVRLFARPTHAQLPFLTASTHNVATCSCRFERRHADVTEVRIGQEGRTCCVSVDFVERKSVFLDSSVCTFLTSLTGLK